MTERDDRTGMGSEFEKNPQQPGTEETGGGTGREYGGGTGTDYGGGTGREYGGGEGGASDLGEGRPQEQGDWQKRDPEQERGGNI